MLIGIFVFDEHVAIFTVALIISLLLSLNTHTHQLMTVIKPLYGNPIQSVTKGSSHYETPSGFRNV